LFAGARRKLAKRPEAIADGCTLGCGHQWIDDARVMITRADRPDGAGAALGLEQPASCAQSLWDVPVYRSALTTACAVRQGVVGRAVIGWPGDLWSIRMKRGQT
jgi:hypothetical protein